MRVLILLALALVAGACGAQPGAFPGKPVRFIIGFTPGGPSDILARAVGQKLGERWGQQVVIENRPGAGGNLAAEAVARSAPDGHTWLLGNNSILATNQSLYRRLPWWCIRKCRRIPSWIWSFLRSRILESSTTRLPAPALRRTWRASCSRRWPASTWCTCPTRGRSPR